MPGRRASCHAVKAAGFRPYRRWTPARFICSSAKSSARIAQKSRRETGSTPVVVRPESPARGTISVHQAEFLFHAARQVFRLPLAKARQPGHFQQFIPSAAATSGGTRRRRAKNPGFLLPTNRRTGSGSGPAASAPAAPFWPPRRRRVADQGLPTASPLPSKVSTPAFHHAGFAGRRPGPISPNSLPARHEIQRVHRQRGAIAVSPGRARQSTGQFAHAWLTSAAFASLTAMSQRITASAGRPGLSLVLAVVAEVQPHGVHQLDPPSAVCTSFGVNSARLAMVATWAAKAASSGKASTLGAPAGPDALCRPGFPGYRLSGTGDPGPPGQTLAPAATVSPACLSLLTTTPGWARAG